MEKIRQNQDTGPAISFLGGGKKRTSETGDSDDCSSWLRPQTESDWLRPPESHDTGNSHEATLNSPQSSSKNCRIRGKRTVNTPPRYPPVSGPTCVNWKCPICQLEITGKTEQVASRKREHVKTKHPDRKYETVISRPKIIVCEASEDIPQEQSAWNCPLCNRGLPSLPRRAAMLAVSAHRKKFHAEITTKEWKSRMVSLWAKGVRKPLVAKRSREKAEQSRADKWPSHDLVEIRITSERALKFRNPRQFWCLGCMAKLAGYGAGNSRPKIEGLTCTDTRNLPHAKQRVKVAWKAISAGTPVGGSPVYPRLHQCVRNLLEDGDVEAQPRPLQTVCLNTNGSAGAWHVLRLMKERNLQVAAIQETAFSDAELTSFQEYAFKQGYRFSLAKQRQGSRGAGILVDKKLVKTYSLNKWTEEDCQAVAVCVQGTVFISIFLANSAYAPQAQQEILGFLSENLRSRPWVICGDWNNTPGECDLVQVLLPEGCKLVAVQGSNNSLQPTRFEGHRAIDYAITNITTEDLRPTFVELKLSDHKMISFQVPTVSAQNPEQVFVTRPQSLSDLMRSSPWKNGEELSTTFGVWPHRLPGLTVIWFLKKNYRPSGYGK